MNILVSLSYYKPHLSGLTLCVSRLVKGLGCKSLQFTVLTSRHNKRLPKEEKEKHIHIIRLPVIATLGKVPLMPTFPFAAWELVQESDIVWIHIPQIEGLLVTWYAKLLHKKILVTVHCLPLLPSGWQRTLFQSLSDFINNSVIKLSDHVVYYTQDYAEHTKELFHDPKKSSYIFPPIPEAINNKQKAGNKKEDTVFRIGFAGRIAEDKGLEYLLEALSLMKEWGEYMELLIAGPRNAVGEKRYQKKIDQLLEKTGNSVKFLGAIPPEKMTGFYRSIDCLVLPSVNRTEAFGMVQVEAMKYGVPVIASDLPGVRIPVRLTQNGVIVQPKNSNALADAIASILKDKKSRSEVRKNERAVLPIGNATEQYRHVFSAYFP